jgi:hypothetical protein
MLDTTLFRRRLREVTGECDLPAPDEAFVHHCLRSLEVGA